MSEVTALVTFQNSKGSAPTLLSYSTDDPYIVKILFDTSHGTITWEVDRDILNRGLSTTLSRYGIGDIQTWSVFYHYEPKKNSQFYLRLSSPDGETELHTDLNGIAEFLRKVYTLCPYGTESDFIDMDRVCEKLLES